MILRGAVAGAPGGQQGGQDGPADDAGQVSRAVGADAAGRGQFLAGGFQGGGEAGPVGVGAGLGLHGGDHRHAQQLVKGEQGPQFLLDAGPVPRAQHAAAQQGVPQGQERGLSAPRMMHLNLVHRQIRG